MVAFELTKSKKQIQINTSKENLDLIRETLSVSNPLYRLKKNKFTPKRFYCITPSGKVDIGLLSELIKVCKQKNLVFSINNDLKSVFFCGVKTTEDDLVVLNLEYRPYQKEIITLACSLGRGTFVLATAGGKTLTTAGIIETLRTKLNNPSLRSLVIVPNLQLVEQTSKDFVDYGLKNVSKWSGKNNYDEKSDTVVCNTQLLLSKNTDLSVLSTFDVIFIDECQTLKKQNELDDIFKYITTPFRFALTGTLPDNDKRSLWNIYGKTGPLIYEEKAKSLMDKGYITNVNVYILKINYNDYTWPDIDHVNEHPTKYYNDELEYLTYNNRRNDIIINLALKCSKNTIITIDRIKQGELLFDMLKQKVEKDRPIFFIRGSTPIEEREQIRELMKTANNVIIVAISKIFSTGINIPSLTNIIFATIGKSTIKICQTIGRALRLSENKERAIIFDLQDQTKYGILHGRERIELYKKEKFNYATKEIK
jgi:superfamily II DNA or RNA helicase